MIDWIDRRDALPDPDERVLVYSPDYDDNDHDASMRYRVLTGQFIRIATDVTHWARLTHPNTVRETAVRLGQVFTTKAYGRVRFDGLDFYMGECTARLKGIDRPGTHYVFPERLEKEGFTIVDA